MILLPIFSLQTNEDFLGLSFKKIIAHRKFKGSVIHTLVVISLMLSTFFLNRAEITALKRLEFFLEEKSK